MENEVIELRGHHLDGLAERLIERQRNIYAYVPQSIEYYEKKLELEIEKWLKSLDGGEKLFDPYSKEFNEQSDYLDEKLLNNPNLKIKIVRGFDSFCRMCPNREPRKGRVFECDPEIAKKDKSDKKSVNEFGLKYGKVYTSAQIVEALKAYQMKTGRISPRKRVSKKSSYNLYLL